MRIIDGPVPCRASTSARSARTSCATGWRLACLAQATSDLAIEVPPLSTRPKAATVGVGRQVILRPAVQKRYLELTEPTLHDQVTDVERILAAIDDLELQVDLDVLRDARQDAAGQRLQGHGGRSSTTC